MCHIILGPETSGEWVTILNVPSPAMHLAQLFHARNFFICEIACIDFGVDFYSAIFWNEPIGNGDTLMNGYALVDNSVILHAEKGSN